MNKVAKNYFYNVSYQLLLIILPLITTPYISRVLGANGVGIYSYTNSITQYFILLGCIGLNLYSQREIAYYQNNVKKRNRTFFELFFLRFITLSISILVFYFTLVTHSKYSYIFLIQILDIIASAFDISWFFQGIEDFKKTVLRNFLLRIICVVLIFTFVKSKQDLQLYVLCYSGTLLLGNLSLWLYMPRYVKKSDIKNINIRKHIKPAVMLFLPQIATSVYTLLDKTMIGLITNDTAEVAYYEQSQTIVKTAMTLITSLGTAMMPRIANLFKNDDYKKIKEYMHTSINFVLLFSIPFSFGIIAIAKGFVPWFYGSGYGKVIPNMELIAPIIVFIGMTNVIGTQYLLPLGRQKEYTISVVIGCLCNVILNSFLILHFQSLGASVATLLAEFIILIVQLYFVRNDFELKIIISTIKNYLIAAVVMLVTVRFFSTYLTVSIKNTFIEIFIGGVVYSVLMILLKDNFIIKILTKIKTKLCKN